MELSHETFMEELLSLKRDAWNTFPNGVMNEFLPDGWRSFDAFDESMSNLLLGTSNPSLPSFQMPPEPNLGFPFPENFPSFDRNFTIPPAELNSSFNNNDETPPPLPLPIQEDYPSVVDDEEFGLISNDNQQTWEENKSILSCCKLDVEQAAAANSFSVERKPRGKRIEGQPSKNLMAERRRRKRLNDRLSMLRSIVPKISKMDRTSILGDTIDYMKELLDRINKIQEEVKGDSDQVHLNTFKETKACEAPIRNLPKFDVERRSMDTQIEICCSAKPGLLLSTVSTLEALGLEIQHCVISCFNDFSVQASCSEGAQQQTMISPEDIKQALFRNAGYGGRCL